MCLTFIIKLVLLFAFLWQVACGSAVAQGFEVGVNVVGVDHMTPAQQATVLAALKLDGVHVIRCGISDDDKGVDFGRRAYAAGVKIDWVLRLAYRADAPKRSKEEMATYKVWQAPPLSYADPEPFRAKIGPQLQRLEQAGIVLAGLELGNELNTAAYNGDFTLPGHGQLFGLDGLEHDPAGQAVAKGYLQYLKVLAALKDLRDHSRLNRQTPIISAGLTLTMQSGAYHEWKTDGVTLNATLQFWRQNGIDKFVDAYGVHAYPWSNAPGRPEADDSRAKKLEQFVLAECGTGDGSKPCWVTEWGFAYKDESCPPVDEAAHVALVAGMMSDFRKAVQKGRLKGLLYFGWNADTWQKSSTAEWAIFRCGSLTESGRIAIDWDHSH